jgi:serine/threonine protein kinase
MFPQIFGKYVLERELSAGGMARVYLATLRGAVGFEKRLVVKQIRPELSLDAAFVRRFVEEAKIAVELSHPNIVPVYELGVELGIYYIAMELCEGLTLTEILNDTGPLDAAEGAYVGIEICRALDYAHRRGAVVHRDVTPRNVLLDEEGAVRLIDFGIAAPVARADDDVRVEVFGSPGHMPPEQLRGEPLTAATDVFAVGVLLIEAWTGRPPFRRGSFQASAEALREPPPSLADWPELAPIAEAVTQTLALSAADRPQDAETLARKLRDFSRQFDSGDVAKRLGARVRRARRRARSAEPWPPGDSSGPHTALPTSPTPFTGHGSPQTPATPPMPRLTPLTPANGPETRTFAARDDLVEWTRKLASVPPPPEDQPNLTPPAPSERLEPATPSAKLPASPRRSRGLLAGGTLAALGLVALLGLQNRAPSPLQPPLPSATLGATPPLAAPPPLPVPLASVTSGAEPSASAASPRPSPTKPALSAVPASEEGVAAQLRMTADPQATVTVVGGRISRTSLTPVRALKLPPGVYSVTFRSSTFGEPVVARVELGAGASRSVHADFRAALPTVVVH